MKQVPANRYFIFGLLVCAGLVWDLYSKSAVFSDLGYPAGSNRPLATGKHSLFAYPQDLEGQSTTYLTGWVTFRLYTSFNEGALWGLGQGYTRLFTWLSVVAIVAVIYWMFVHGAARSLWLTISLAAIMAGTLGNLYDRLAVHGYVDANGHPIHAVRDFLLFTFGSFHWPVFNFADSFLVTGAIMLLVQSFQPEDKPESAVNESTSNAPAEAATP